ncbi:glutamate receptor ionotropic, delta-1-like [Macrobrachium rosenbergii]|uniref:glutamate receptor ionotropic, delta-1-like n=1 Tax=Macrobrachium rosenbergii TaxID=79674 RepID=UPI0034D3FE7C
MWPDTQVVFVGYKIKATSFLRHRALRNTIQPLLFSLEEAEPKSKGITSSSVDLSPERIILAGYSRCLYCQNGYSKVVSLFRRPLDAIDPKRLNISVDPVENFQGTKFRVTSLSYFPYIDNRLNSEEPGRTVTILDSLDKRILDTLTGHANFTFEATAPPDMIPGYLSSNGSWNGMMLDIAELGADFSTCITINPDRLKILDKVRTCETDWICIVSPQPRVLPRYLVITRTFAADVWIYLLVTIMIWGVCLWALQRTESRLSGEGSESLSESILYGWAAIVDHPPEPPSNLVGQMMVGWLQSY